MTISRWGGMKEKTYRLDEYKIVESDCGQLTWESHLGFGEFQTGPCYKKGSILFIGPPESRRNGFLKGEFVDDLKKYSNWNKTVYFCNGSDLHYCKSGKSVTKEEMMLWSLGRSLGERGETDRDAPRASPAGVSGRQLAENAVYRLQRYEIMVKADGPMVARTYSGTNSVNCGTCFILEDILFIGPQQIEPSKLEKRPFIEKLHQLPQWDQTDFFLQEIFLASMPTGKRDAKRA